MPPGDPHLSGRDGSQLGKVLAKAFDKLDRPLAEKIEAAGIQNIEIIEIRATSRRPSSKTPSPRKENPQRAEDEALPISTERFAPVIRRHLESARALSAASSLTSSATTLPGSGAIR